MNKLISFLLVCQVILQSNSFHVKKLSKLSLKLQKGQIQPDPIPVNQEVRLAEVHQDDDGEEEKQPGLDISESELPLIRCDQVIGIDGLKIDDPLDIGMRSPAHLQLNFNNANLFEDGADPSSLVTSIGWDAIDIPLVVYTNGDKCVQFRSTLESKEFGFCAEDVAIRKQMVFAIELLIECRKGINIGQNQFEYREIPEEVYEDASELPMKDEDSEDADGEEAQENATDEEQAQEDADDETEQKLAELNGEVVEEEEDEPIEFDEEEIDPSMTLDENIHQQGIEAAIEADKDAAEKANQEESEDSDDEAEKGSKSKEEEPCDKKLRFAGKSKDMAKQAMFMIKKSQMAKSKKAKKLAQKSKSVKVHHSK